MVISKIRVMFFSAIFLFLSFDASALVSLSPKSNAQIAQFFGLKSAQHFTLLNLYAYQQQFDYTCGPAAVMSLLHYYGKLSDKEMTKATELRIAQEMGTTTELGTSPQQMAAWLSQHGFTVKSGRDGNLVMLRDNLSKNIPTLVEWIDWGGHWVLVAGYNAVGKTPEEDKDTIIFADPSAKDDNEKTTNGLVAFNPDRFVSMWFDAQYFEPGHVVKGVYITAVPSKE